MMHDQATAALRATMLHTAFEERSRAAALQAIGEVIARADALLVERPDDRSLAVQRAITIGYRGRVARSITDATTSRRVLEQLVQDRPDDPEALVALAGWHHDVARHMGVILAATLMGARRATGEALLDRAERLSAGRADLLGFATLLRTRSRFADVARLKALAAAAASAPGSEPIDERMRAGAAAILALLEAGDRDGAARHAGALMPFGTLED